MAKYLKRPKGGALYLVWNHTTQYARVGASMLQPFPDGIGRRNQPTAEIGNSLLLTSDDAFLPRALQCASKGLVKVAEILTDDVLSIPFRPNRYGARVLGTAQIEDLLKGGATREEPEEETSATPPANPNLAVFDGPIARPVEDAIGPSAEEAESWEEVEDAEGDEEESPASPEDSVDEAPVIPTAADDEPIEEESEEAATEDPVEEEDPGVSVVDQDLFDIIPWDDLPSQKRDDLREYGKAFEPPVNGVKKDDIIAGLIEARDAVAEGD